MLGSRQWCQQLLSTLFQTDTQKSVLPHIALLYLGAIKDGVECWFNAVDKNKTADGLPFCCGYQEMFLGIKLVFLLDSAARLHTRDNKRWEKTNHQTSVSSLDYFEGACVRVRTLMGHTFSKTPSILLKTLLCTGICSHPQLTPESPPLVAARSDSFWSIYPSPPTSAPLALKRHPPHPLFAVTWKYFTRFTVTHFNLQALFAQSQL